MSTEGYEEGTGESQPGNETGFRDPQRLSRGRWRAMREGFEQHDPELAKGRAEYEGPVGADRRGGFQTAFVLGGGANLGAHEVGMLRALFEAGIRPDLVIGTSVGAVNAAVVAAFPGLAAVGQLEALWIGLGRHGVFGASFRDRLGTAVRSRTHLYSSRPLRACWRPACRSAASRIFGCRSSASLRASNGPWITGSPRGLSSTRCSRPARSPACWPRCRSAESISSTAVWWTASRWDGQQRWVRAIYVLQVGRVERPLRVPRQPWEVAAVAFEMARRHRFVRSMADLPRDVTVHVLPTGTPSPDYADIRQHLQYRNASLTRSRIGAAYRASARYRSVLPCPAQRDTS